MCSSDLDESPALSPEKIAAAKRFFKEKKLGEIKASAKVDSINRPFVEARRLAAQDTITEAELITPAMMQMAGMNGAEIAAGQSSLAAGNGVNANVATASILRGLNPTIRREMKNAKELALAERGSCMLDADSIMAATPNTLGAMSDVMERKFGPFDANASKQEQLNHGERIRQYIAQRYQYAVIAHEMGHSIGLRHNFVSSYFAWGFRPQYWQIGRASCRERV